MEYHKRMMEVCSRAQKLLKETTGIAFEVFTDISSFAIKVRYESTVRFQTSSKMDETRLLEHIHEIIDNVRQGSFVTSIREEHVREIKAFEQEIKELQKFKIFYEKLKEAGAINLPDIMFLDVPSDKRLKLIRDCNHGDDKTALVFPERWPTIPAGTTVEFIKKWENLYGTQISVRHKGVVYDITPQCVDVNDRHKFDKTRIDG